MISAELRSQVELKVSEVVSSIERMYNTKFFKPIEIRYDINSARLGGQALLSSFVVRLNPIFLAKYKEEYINSTVVHEVAHLGCTQVYTRDKGYKVDHHGREWKQMMVKLGANPSRCHTYEAEEGQGRQKTKYGYVCSHCNAPIVVGPVVHKKLKVGAQYRTKCCKAALSFKGTVGAVPKVVAIQRIAANDLEPTVQVNQPKVKAPDPTSKLGRCYDLYKKYHGQRLIRPQWIQMFVTKADCTPAGASTYLSTCVKLFEQGA